MKNLFSYAPKELSQDAFLCWLFNNSEEKEIEIVAKELLSKMVNLSKGYNVDPSRLTDVVAYTQVQKIDIVVDFKLDGEPCILVIEDKTRSDEHGEQLIRYKKIVSRWNSLREEYNNRQSFFVYYKTNNIQEEEHDRVISSEWIEFPFEQIADFWKRYVNNNNLIVHQYAEHVVELWEDSQTVERPKTNNLNQWTSYFNKVICPELRQQYGEVCEIVVRETRFGYSYLKVYLKNLDFDCPYLEVRSRDCLNDEFVARLLVYDVKTDEDGFALGFHELRNFTKDKEYLGVLKSDRSLKQNKQIGRTPKSSKYEVTSNKDFINFCKEAINQYIETAKYWCEVVRCK